MRAEVPQLAKPEGGELGQHRALAGDRLTHHHIERAHPVAGHQQEPGTVHFVHLPHLASAEERQGEAAGNDVYPHLGDFGRRWRAGPPGRSPARGTRGGIRPTCASRAAGVAGRIELRGEGAGRHLGKGRVRASRAIRSFLPPALTASAATFMLAARMTSWRAWRSPPASTPSISHRSVAMKGICAATLRAITGSRTSSPATMLVASTRIASVARNASGSTSRRVGTVVEGALQPLGGGGLRRVLHQRHHEPGEAGNPLGPHRIPLVGHGAGADLLRFEGLPSSSPSCWSSRRSPAIFAADCARPERTSSTALSVFLG